MTQTHCIAYIAKSLVKSTYITFAFFLIFISLPALIQKKLNWFDIAFSQVSAGCCSLGARVGRRVCGRALSAYNFLAFYWHNHSLSLKVFQASSGRVAALKIIFHFRVNTKSHYRDTNRKLSFFPQMCEAFTVCK